MHDSPSRPIPRLLLLLTLPALLTFNTGAEGGCANAEDSEDVAQDEIVSQLWLYYNAKTDRTDVRATYRFGHEGGTILQLTAPARVTFAGKELGFDPNWGWHHIEVPGVADGGTLTYTNNDGQSTDVSTGNIPRIAFPGGLTALPRDANTTLTWQGSPLEAGEEVELFVASVANRLNFVRFTANKAGDTAVVVTPNRLAQLPPGATLLAWKRHKSRRVDARTKLTLSYESADLPIELR